MSSENTHIHLANIFSDRTSFTFQVSLASILFEILCVFSHRLYKKKFFELVPVLYKSSGTVLKPVHPASTILAVDLLITKNKSAWLL